MAAALLSACGAHEPGHSDYFVITFLANTPAPSDEGVLGLDHAVAQAGRHRPSSIIVTAAAEGSDALPALTQQRIAVITEAFVKSGVDARLVHAEPRVYDAKSYAARKDSFIVQLAYGP